MNIIRYKRGGQPSHSPDRPEVTDLDIYMSSMAEPHNEEGMNDSEFEQSDVEENYMLRRINNHTISWQGFHDTSFTKIPAEHVKSDKFFHQENQFMVVGKEVLESVAANPTWPLSGLKQQVVDDIQVDVTK
ncbi:hypothetical protein TIFTF001_011382 [Ficus carica]|uniref:Uncharacterized protein n=1 Tax=Ficus carica TaxID=3494 RepID=A0AA88D5B6_FICCA|nr:hypothetical protein TIFTF001_011382 [Ficus carica]